MTKLKEEIIKDFREKFWNKFANNYFDLGTNNPDDITMVKSAKKSLEVFLSKVIDKVGKRTRDGNNDTIIGLKKQVEILKEVAKNNIITREAYKLLKENKL